METTQPIERNKLADAASSSPAIHTYHCLCTNLILASTTPFPSLVRRSATSLDNAYILPLPPPPSSSTDLASASVGPSSPSTSNNGHDIEKQSRPVPAETNKDGHQISLQEQRHKNTEPHFAFLLGCLLDRKPIVVRRSDGFEKRYVQRCGRCKLVVGYQLDWAQFPITSGTDKSGQREDENQQQQTERREGRRADVVYVLPGGLMDTQEMCAGKDMSSEIGFQGLVDVAG